MNDLDLDERFAGYPAETLALIHEFQRTRDPALVPALMNGILTKYLPGGGSLPVGSTPEETLGAFGFESLTLIEVLLDFQDAFGITLSDEELRAVSDLAGVRALLTAKVAALRGVPP